MPKTTTIPGQQDLVREAIARCPESGKLLDIGTGTGLAARGFAAAGWDVTATGFHVEDDLGEIGPFPDEIDLIEDVDVRDLSRFPDNSFDVVWCAHVIEHVLDTGRALAEIRRILKPDGRLFLTVPPFKHEVVGGHVTPGWNIGILMYVLAVSGLGVRDGRFVRHGYNVFADVGKGDGPLPPGTLSMSNGDIERLADLERLPAGEDYQQGFNGNRTSLNWAWTTTPVELAVASRSTALIDERPLRIAFLVPWLTKGRGGTENVGRSMANAMAERGHAVRIITFDNARGQPQWPLREDVALSVLGEGIDPVHDAQICLEIASFGADLIVGLHMNRGMLQYARVARKLQIPLVISEHGEADDVIDRGTNSRAEREVAFHAASAVHVVNEAARRGLPADIWKKTAAVPNTVPPGRMLAEVGRTDGPLSLLFVGRLVRNKKVHLLLEVFSVLSEEFPNWRLQIVGDGPERLRLEEQARALGVSRRVDFHGEYEDTYPFYEAAQLFCITSVAEIFGLVTLEAMAHGLPVVAMKSSVGATALVEDGKTGILADEPFVEDSLRSALKRAMQDADLRRDLGAAGLRRYREHFSPEVIETQWEEMFRSAVRGFEAAGRPPPDVFAEVILDQQIYGAMQRLSGAL